MDNLWVLLIINTDAEPLLKVFTLKEHAEEYLFEYCKAEYKDYNEKDYEGDNPVQEMQEYGYTFMIKKLKID